jgi:hypothetical protein
LEAAIVNGEINNDGPREERRGRGVEDGKDNANGLKEVWELQIECQGQV